MTERQGTYLEQKISPGEKPFWTDFKKDIGEIVKSRENPIKIELVETNPKFYVNQMSGRNFVNFEEEDVVAKTGVNAEIMRAEGCGISCLFMALSTINGEEFYNKYGGQVGIFAEKILSLHRNDSTLPDGTRIKGTPVFNRRSGWYHNAFIHAAHIFGRLNGFRVEDVSLEEVALVVKKLEENGCRTAVIASVFNGPWRGDESDGSHLVLLNGFDLNKSRFLNRIKVTDPFPLPDPLLSSPKINQWVDGKRDAFTGKFIILYQGEDFSI